MCQWTRMCIGMANVNLIVTDTKLKMKIKFFIEKNAKYDRTTAWQANGRSTEVAWIGYSNHRETVRNPNERQSLLLFSFDDSCVLCKHKIYNEMCVWRVRVCVCVWPVCTVYVQAARMCCRFLDSPTNTIDSKEYYTTIYTAVYLFFVRNSVRARCSVCRIESVALAFYSVCIRCRNAILYDFTQCSAIRAQIISVGSYL